MITRMYGVYDGVAKAFATPFFMRSDAEAIRAFSAEVNNPTSVLCQNRADFSLHLLAEFDDGSGEVVAAGKMLVKAAAVYLTPVEKEGV